MNRPFLDPRVLRCVENLMALWYTVEEIQSLFEHSGIRLVENYNPPINSRSSDLVCHDLIRGYFASINLTNWRQVQKLIKSIESVVSYCDEIISNDWEGRYTETSRLLETLSAYLVYDGFSLRDSKIVYTRDSNYSVEVLYTASDELPPGLDLFQSQFPAGLPFGTSKPAFAIIPKKGGQTLKFDTGAEGLLLKNEVYPNLSYQRLMELCKPDTQTDPDFRKQLDKMSQTPNEKEFFRAYAQTFKMATSDIPVLIPQAWIQWHSLPKHNLREQSSSHADDLYRIDFVAFWNNKRYAILIDDIGHYAKKAHTVWQADEAAYSKRLKEDRKLQKEKWHVFRVSNWEIRNEELLPEILSDLKEFIGFGE